MGNYQVIALTNGYVESNSTAWLIMTAMNNAVKFKTPQDAIQSLAAEMWIKYQHDKGLIGHYANECCQKQDPKARFCNVCGKSTKKKGFDRDDFQEFIVELFGTDNDSYGADCHFKDDYDTEDNAQWAAAGWPSQAALKNPKGVVIVNEYAEKVLAEALDPKITGLTEKERKWFLTTKF